MQESAAQASEPEGPRDPSALQGRVGRAVAPPLWESAEDSWCPLRDPVRAPARPSPRPPGARVHCATSARNFVCRLAAAAGLQRRTGEAGPMDQGMDNILRARPESK